MLAPVLRRHPPPALTRPSAGLYPYPQPAPWGHGQGDTDRRCGFSLTVYSGLISTHHYSGRIIEGLLIHDEGAGCLTLSLITMQQGGPLLSDKAPGFTRDTSCLAERFKGFPPRREDREQASLKGGGVKSFIHNNADTAIPRSLQGPCHSNGAVPSTYVIFECPS